MVFNDKDMINSCKQEIKELEQQIYELKQENRGLRKEIHKIRPLLKQTSNQDGIIIDVFDENDDNYHPIVLFYHNNGIGDKVLESIAQKTYDDLMRYINE